MRRRRLGDRLRALILAAPLIGTTRCGNFPVVCTNKTVVYSLVNPVDGGSLVVSAGECGPACEILLGASDCREPVFCIVDAGCFLLDGGTSVSCTFTPACGGGGRRPASLLASPMVRARRPSSDWRRRLGHRLRTLALAGPLLSPLMGCGSPCPTPTFPGCGQGCPIIYDAVTPWDGGAGFMPDGGLDCLLACPVIDEIDKCSPTTTDGGLAIDCTNRVRCEGRRPSFLLSQWSEPALHHEVGRYFAGAARLEAASIPAFHVLANELRVHRAPAHLVHAARRSAQDEVRHARSTAALARRYRAEPIRPAFGPTPSERSLEAIATENAIEGCVRETYGALVALWQAGHARDPVVATAMRPIAADETRHAELAWEVAAWAEPRLSPAARGRIDAAKAQALAELAGDVACPVAVPLIDLAGLPPVETATALLSGLAGELLASSSI
jgi:hypothetical protein